MDVLRRCLFRKWNLRLMDEWWQWMKKLHRKSWKRVDKWASGKPKWVTWNSDSKRYEWNKLSDGRGHYKSWFRRRHTGNKDFHAGRDALFRAVESTWWDWKAGSRPFYWQWKPEQQMEMRDGKPENSDGNFSAASQVFPANLSRGTFQKVGAKTCESQLLVPTDSCHCG